MREKKWEGDSDCERIFVPFLYVEVETEFF